MSINVFLIDDLNLVREGLQRLLETEKDIVVAGNTSNGCDAVRRLIETCPEIAILSVDAPGSAEIERTKEIRESCPSTQVIIISSRLSSEDILLLLNAGATGYVLAESADTEIVSAIRAVHGGRRYLSERISDLLLDYYVKNGKTLRSKNPISRLNMREREILQLVAEGKTSAQIAKILSLSSKTVSTYRHRITEKLGIDDRTGLVRFAIENGLTPLYKQNEKDAWQ